MSVTLRAADKNGTPYACFKTYDVLENDRVIGLVQCLGPCYGPSAEPRHKHTKWMAFVGPDGERARNISGAHPSPEIAAEHVQAWIKRNGPLSLR